MKFIKEARPSSDGGDLAVDLVSDLHADYWDRRYHGVASIVIGPQLHAPAIRPSSGPRRPRILVVAGDTTDSMPASLRYLDEQFRAEYDWILLVDGNHEHMESRPRLFPHAAVEPLVRAWNERRDGARLVYLPLQTFRIGGVAFVGSCLWWDYASGRRSPSHHDDAYSRAVRVRAREDWDDLRRRLETLNTDPTVTTVVVVSHTVPHAEVLNWSSQDSGTHVNAAASAGILRERWRFPKVKFWLSGHSHDTHDQVMGGVRLVANPRGRPLDHNRVWYARRSVLIRE